MKHKREMLHVHMCKQEIPVTSKKFQGNRIDYLHKPSSYENEPRDEARNDILIFRTAE